MNISNINIEVEYKNIKNIHLAVYPPDARVHVSAPEYITENDLRAYLLTKTDWVSQKQKEILEQERETIREYISGENHYLFGRRYILRVLEEDAHPKIVKETKYLKMYVRPGTIMEKRQEVLYDYYRTQLHEKLTELFAKWKELTGEDNFTWAIHAMKTRWGSCSTQRRSIRMNLALARIPVECIEYVLVHEMTHLRVKNHNKAFVALLSKYLPNWRKTKQQLDSFISVSLYN